jgi:hypothetical protein
LGKRISKVSGLFFRPVIIAVQVVLIVKNRNPMKIDLKKWIVRAGMLGLFLGAGLTIAYLVVNGAQ